MTISDEILMAYADGELDSAARSEVEAAMREDPEIARRVAAHRLLRQRVQAAYAAELEQEVPERLLAMVPDAGGSAAKTANASWSKTAKAALPAAADVASSKVVNIGDARAALEQRTAPRARPPPTPPQWRTLGGIAASVIAGVGLGFFMWGRTQSPLVQGANGALVARGQLAQALSTQLAAEQPQNSAVHIGLSFLAKSGDYCRTFALSGAVSPAGVACRHGAEWQVDTVAAGAADAGRSDYRTAGSPMSAAILKSVEAQIAGEPLDQAAERAARQRGWTPLR
jgi:hypothetical protein